MGFKNMIGHSKDENELWNYGKFHIIVIYLDPSVAKQSLKEKFPRKRFRHANFAELFSLIILVKRSFKFD